jgi:hypothetical protein
MTETDPALVAASRIALTVSERRRVRARSLLVVFASRVPTF